MPSTSTYRKQLKARILKYAMSEFTTKGIRAVKMDDIAAHLGISKRTLYEIYADKEALLFACVSTSHEEHERQMLEYSQVPGHTVMDIIVEFYHRQIAMNGKVNPAFYAELQRYPKIVKYHADKRKEGHTRAVDFFSRGVKEGFFRADVDYDIIQNIGDASLHYVMEKQIYKMYTIPEIFRNFIVVFIRGFCTQKGLAVIDNLRL